MTMASAPPSTLIATAKASGRCSPSLIGEDRIIDGGVFESNLLRSLDGGESFRRAAASPSVSNDVGQLPILLLSWEIRPPRFRLLSDQRLFLPQLSMLSHFPLALTVVSLPNYTGLNLSSDPSAVEAFSNALKVSARLN